MLSAQPARPLRAAPARNKSLVRCPRRHCGVDRAARVLLSDLFALPASQVGSPGEVSPRRDANRRRTRWHDKQWFAYLHSVWDEQFRDRLAEFWSRRLPDEEPKFKKTTSSVTSSGTFD